MCYGSLEKGLNVKSDGVRSIYFLAAFLAAGFLAFLAAGFLALGFLALGFLALGSLAGSLKEPAPFLPAAAAETTFLAAISFLRARLTRTPALAASTLLPAMTAFLMAWREDPFLSPRVLMAATIM